MREFVIPSESVLEPVLVLSAPTMLLPIEAPSVEDGAARDDGATTEPSAAPSAWVQAGLVVAEPQ